MPKCFLQRGKRVATLEVLHRLAQYNVSSIGQCAFRKRLKRAPSHEHSVACGELFEASQILAEMVDEVVFKADSPILGHSGYQSNVHTVACYFFLVFDIQTSNGYFRVDMRPWIIVSQLKVFVFEVENALHIGIEAHFGEWSRLACEL